MSEAGIPTTHHCSRAKKLPERKRERRGGRAGGGEIYRLMLNFAIKDQDNSMN